MYVRGNNRPTDKQKWASYQNFYSLLEGRNLTICVVLKSQTRPSNQKYDSSSLKFHQAKLRIPDYWTIKQTLGDTGPQNYIILLILNYILFILYGFL
jgi:hypothetical protein